MPSIPSFSVIIKPDAQKRAFDLAGLDIIAEKAR